MTQAEKLEQLRAEIQLGIDDAELGHVYRFTSAEDLRQAVQTRIQERRNQKRSDLEAVHSIEAE
jgi:hypothetical protein